MLLRLLRIIVRLIFLFSILLVHKFFVESLTSFFRILCSWLYFTFALNLLTRYYILFICLSIFILSSVKSFQIFIEIAPIIIFTFTLKFFVISFLPSMITFQLFILVIEILLAILATFVILFLFHFFSMNLILLFY